MMVIMVIVVDMLVMMLVMIFEEVENKNKFKDIY